eukprot:6567605-Pyramimonas_sp.AAC.1
MSTSSQSTGNVAMGAPGGRAQRADGVPQPARAAPDVVLAQAAAAQPAHFDQAINLNNHDWRG